MASPLDQLAPANVDRGGRAVMFIAFLILFMLFTFVTLLSFPGQWVKRLDPVTNQCVVDYCRLYGISFGVAIFLTLIIWLISMWAC
jgi:hypothetical protein